MIFKTIVGLLIVLMGCSGNRQTSKFELQIENDPDQQMGLKSGLLFEYGGYRGTGYTDSLGNNYNLRSNPVTITNDSTISIQIELAFSKEYDYPNGYDDENFRVFPLPKEWAQNGTPDSLFDRIWLEFENHLDKPFQSETIEPGEQFVFAIGTLYPSQPEILWVVPNELFAHSAGGIFATCDWQMNEDPLLDSEMALGLKLHLNEGCIIIPCGRASYPQG